MKILAALLLAFPLAAQQAEPKPEAAKPAEEKPAETPAPAAEKTVEGSIEFGYRVVGNIRGRQETYRSLVNLQEGPRLFGFDFAIQDPARHLFDRVDLTASGWGGDPNSLLRVHARRNELYHFSLDYRNIAYYNYLPSFADPGPVAGAMLNQRAFDINRRYVNLDLELFPTRRFIPYLGYSHDSGSGTGVTPYVTDGNEYPVWNRLRDKTDTYRGGLRIEMNRFHVTLKQGGSKFKDDQFVGWNGRNLGNRAGTLLGQRLLLTDLSQAYGVRGDSIYSKILATAAPAPWLDLHGQFLYSRPSSDVTYSESAAGLFALLAQARFYTGQYDTLFAAAKQPHTSGSAGFEIRPLKGLRIVESILTDRFHNASSAVLAEQLLLASATTGGVTSTLNSLDRLVYNFSRQQTDVIYDAGSKLTLRGGQRYEWGDATVRSGALNLAGSESGELKRHVGLAGVSFRPLKKLALTWDYERGAGDRSYFRTSLYDHYKIRARARYQLMPSLLLAANFTVLDNQNPTAGINYRFQSRSNTLSLQWLPQGGKHASLLGEYSRATLSSDLSFLDPLYRTRERSYYWDNAHVASGMLDINLPAVSGSKGKVSLGGSMFLSHGSRPTNLYQPIWRLQMPVVKHVQWFGEWRWYGYSEPSYLYEGFRAHLFLTGLRLSL
jgi:hypothetical protein